MFVEPTIHLFLWWIEISKEHIHVKLIFVTVWKSLKLFLMHPSWTKVLISLKKKQSCYWLIKQWPLLLQTWSCIDMWLPVWSGPTCCLLLSLTSSRCVFFLDWSRRSGMSHWGNGCPSWSWPSSTYPTLWAKYVHWHYDITDYMSSTFFEVTNFVSPLCLDRGSRAVWMERDSSSLLLVCASSFHPSVHHVCVSGSEAHL